MTAVAVIVVNYQGGDLLRSCLASVLSQRPAPDDVLVVDNASTDGSADTLPAGVRLLRMPRNAGYAAALNAGWAATRAPLLLTLNPDTELLPDCLEDAVEALQADPLLGSVAPRVLQAADPECLDASGIGLTSRLGAINCEHGLRRDEADAAPRPVLGPLGGAGLWRRVAVDRAGGWSETQFLYWEDIDLAVRLDRAGYACRTVPTARLLHHGSATVGRWSNRNVFYMVRNHAPSLLATLPGPLLRRHALDLLIAPLRAALLYAGRGRALAAAAGLLAGLARLPAAYARRRHLSRSGTQAKATERMLSLMRSADEERRRMRVAAGRS